MKKKNDWHSGENRASAGRIMWFEINWFENQWAMRKCFSLRWQQFVTNTWNLNIIFPYCECSRIQSSCYFFHFFFPFVIQFICQMLKKTINNKPQKKLFFCWGRNKRKKNVKLIKCLRAYTHIIDCNRFVLCNFTFVTNINVIVACKVLLFNPKTDTKKWKKKLI